MCTCIYVLCIHICNIGYDTVPLLCWLHDIYSYVLVCVWVRVFVKICTNTYSYTVYSCMYRVWYCVTASILDGYCSTARSLLEWFEVDLGFTELLFIQIGLCVMYRAWYCVTVTAALAYIFTYCVFSQMCIHVLYIHVCIGSGTV